MTGFRHGITLAAALALFAGACATSRGDVEGLEGNGVGESWEESEELEQLLAELERSSGGNGVSGADGAGGADNRIGPLDLLDIVVFDAPELSQGARVSSGGEIVLPLIGAIPAAGSTPGELATTIEARLREKYMHDPHVAVQLSEARPSFVYVLGEVNRPGSFAFEGSDRTTVLQAVAMGGGVSPVAAKSRAVLIRTSGPGQRMHIPVNLDRALSGEGVDEPMLANDILFVPRSTPQSVVRGILGSLARIITFRGIF